MNVFTPFLSRLLRVARLDGGVYDEIRDDKAATWQALAVVIVVGLAHAIEGVFLASRGGWNVLRSIIPGFQVEILGWLVWATTMYLIGALIFRSPATKGAVLRALGLAALPGILYALGFLSEVILVVSWLWRIGSSFVAMRQVFALGSARTAAIVLLGGVIAFLIAGYATVGTLNVLAWFGVT
jgi:hypothetical protein